MSTDAKTIGKLPGSKNDIKSKGPEITHKNVKTVGLETSTGKADEKRNIKRKGGAGDAGRKPGRDMLNDYSTEPAATDYNDPNYDDTHDM